MLKVKRTTADFYPRSPCGERLYANFDGFYWWVISIHALLAESDYRDCVRGLIWRISIHALLAESDLICQAPILPCNAFLSTLSLRRATRHKTSKLIINIYFYPRSPCGERRIKPIFSEINTRDFYPRSPCGERPAAGRLLLS